MSGPDIRDAMRRAEAMSRDDLIAEWAAALALLRCDDDPAFDAQFGHLQLTPRQRLTLGALWRRRSGGMVEREALVQLACRNPQEASYDALTSVVRRLRRKILGTGWRIKSRYGVGFTLEREHDRANSGAIAITNRALFNSPQNVHSAVL